MKWKFKKLTSLFAAAAMVITAAVPVFAAGENDNLTDFIKFIEENTTQDGNTVTLKDNIELNQGIPIKKEVLEGHGIEGRLTIDLGGYTVTVKNDVNAIYNIDADVIVQNGTIKMDSSVTNTNAYLLHNLGTMTVDNVTVEGIRGALHNDLGGTMTVKSGTFTAIDYHALYNDHYNSNVTIDGGTFSSVYFGSVYNALGNITINDGTFESNLYSSGNVEVAENGQWVHTENFIYVNGGKFKQNPATVNNVRIKNDFKTEKNGDYYTLVKDEGPIAKNNSGSTIYNDLADLSENGIADIHLLRDINLTEDLILKNHPVIYLDGHNITSSNGAKIIGNTGGGFINENKEITSTVDVEIIEKDDMDLNFMGNVIFNKKITVPQENYLTVTATFNDEITGTYKAGNGARFIKTVFTNPDNIPLSYNHVVLDFDDGYYTVLQNCAKNSTTNKTYTDWDTAVNEANAGDTLELLMDFYTTLTIPEGKDINLKIGKKITADVAIDNKGVLNISSGSSQVKGDIKNSGTLTISNSSKYNGKIFNTGTFTIAGLNCGFTAELQPEWFADGYIFLGKTENSSGNKYYKLSKLTVKTGNAIAAEGKDNTKATGFVTEVYSSAQFNISDIKWSVTVGNETKKTETQELGNIETKSVRLGVIINGIKDDAAVAKASVTASGFVVNEK